jgi:hypothetical protein
VRKIARRVDRLAVVFPFEPALYADRLPSVEFVGHPLIDRVRVTRGREETLRAHGLDPARRTVLLLPGSRPSEIDYLLGHLQDAVRFLGRDAALQFPLALAHTLSADEIRGRVRASGVDVTVLEGDTYNLIAAADVALVSSGTATLECALLDRPMVMVCRRAAQLRARPAPRPRRALHRDAEHRGGTGGRASSPGEGYGARIAARGGAILDDPARHATMVEDLRRSAAGSGAGRPDAPRSRSRCWEAPGGEALQAPRSRTCGPTSGRTRPSPCSACWASAPSTPASRCWPSTSSTTPPSSSSAPASDRCPSNTCRATSGAISPSSSSTFAASSPTRSVSCWRPPSCAAASTGAGYLTDWIGQRVMTDLRNELTAHMQRLDLTYFNRRRAGQIVSRVTADVALVRGLVTDAVTSVFRTWCA